jgi:glycosyltransferase involved in cell wall biosynthesis
LKVVIPVADLHTGGGCNVLVQIAHALMDRGHDVEMVLPQTGTMCYDVRCRLTIVPSLSSDYIPYGDIVLPNFYTTFAPSYQAWPEQCVRLSLGFEPLWVPDKKGALKTYETDTPIIGISHWLDEQIFLHTKKRMKVIHLGVNEHVFYPEVSIRSNRNRPKVIMYIARDPSDYALKGFRDFSDAMILFKNLYPQEFVVHMVCTERALSLDNIPHNTFFPANEIDMANLYRGADIFVSSSWFEAFSLPVLEAMACGTPVVTTDSGGILDFCTHMESAYIVPPKKPERLARGMYEVLSNEVLYTRLADGGRASASRLTKANFAANIVNALEDIYTRGYAI